MNNVYPQNSSLYFTSESVPKKVSKKKIFNRTPIRFIELNDILTSRIFTLYERVIQIPLCHRRFSRNDTLKALIFAENQLTVTRNYTKYFSSKETSLPVGIVVDYIRQEFSILSKRKGSLNISGTFKKVSDALHVLGTEVTLKCRVVNKKGCTIELSEIEYENHYGDPVHQYVEYKERVSYLQESYEGDLSLFLDNITPEQRITILKFLTDKLYEMHANGDVHYDIKTQNILIKFLDPIQLKLQDYGYTHKEEIFLYQCYGTPAYSAPERVQGESTNKKAEDMYALGCLIYEMYFLINPPWSEKLALFYKNGIGSIEEISTLQNKEYELLISESHSEMDSTNSGYYKILIGLLDPNPLTRLTVRELKIICDELQ